LIEDRDQNGDFRMLARRELKHGSAMLVERLEKGASRSIGCREYLIELAENDRARSEASFQVDRTAPRWNVDLTIKAAPVALRQIGEVGSNIGARRAVMTFNGDAPNLQVEALDRLLGMEDPS
ncbi:MAG TPA: hypothetical protein VF333_03360, partial [Pyrinomonadaceae bacterium]